MTQARSPFAVHESTREEAIGWLIDFCEGEVDPKECERFESWLKASPENVRAYLQLSAFWQAAGDMNRAQRLEVDELVRRAAAEHNIVELDAAPKALALPRVRASSLRRPRLVAAAVLLLACTAGAGTMWWSRLNLFTTQIGEERTISLADGSVVQLNARSRLKVRYTDAERTVELQEGQALFHVAKNPARPFLVLSNGTRVRAVGTQFDVNLAAEGTVVTVVEGVVSVTKPSDTPASAASASVVLAAGDQVSVSPKAIATPRHTDASVATAWTQGKLIFDSTPLSEVVREVNRYNVRPLTIDDPKLLSLHVSGTFATTDSAQIIQFLAQRFGLIVHESADGVRLSHE